MGTRYNAAAHLQEPKHISIPQVAHPVNIFRDRWNMHMSSSCDPRWSTREQLWDIKA